MRSFDRMVKIVFVTALVAFVQAAGAVEEIFVAPDGDDGNPGTESAPLRTAEGARDRLRTRRRSGEAPQGGWRITFADGRYEFARPLELTEEDSGASSAPVVWRSLHKGRALLSGARRLEWRRETDPEILRRLPADVRDRVVSADLPDNVLAPPFQGGGEERVGEKSEDPLQLFQDGVRLACARWPNGREALTGRVGIRADDASSDGWVRSDAPRLDRWKDEPDLWAGGLWEWQFHQKTVQVLDVDASAGMFRVGYRDRADFTVKKGMEYHVLNAYSELDEPGEWVVDRTADRVTYLPPDGRAEAVATGPLNLIAAEGLSCVGFVGFSCECARGDAIALKSCENVRVMASTFRHCGGWGVRGDGVIRCRVDGCDLDDLGKGGIRIDGGDCLTLVRGGNVVENCHVFDYGRIRPSYSPGIFIGGDGNSAVRNLVHHSKHQAILFRGSEHLVARNVIHDVCTHNDDAGAIYCNGQIFNWLARGSVVEDNLILFVGRRPVSYNCEGIYLDDWSSGVIVRGNVVCRANRGVHVGGGNFVTVTNNLLIATLPAVSVGSRGLNSFAKPSLVGGREGRFYRRFVNQTENADWLARFPECRRLLEMSDDRKVFEPVEVVVRDNALVASGPVWAESHIAADPELLKASNNVEFSADDLPGLSRFDFTPRPGSALARFFRGLDPDGIGLYDSKWRASPPVRFGARATPPPCPPRIPYAPPDVRVDVSFKGTLPEGVTQLGTNCTNAASTGARVSTFARFGTAGDSWREYSFSFTPCFDCVASLDVFGAYGLKTAYDDFRTVGCGKIADPGMENAQSWTLYDEKCRMGDRSEPYGILKATSACPAHGGRHYGVANHEYWLVQPIALRKGVPVTITFWARAFK